MALLQHNSLAWFNGSGARFSKVTQTFRARKVNRETPTPLFCKDGLHICCKGNKNWNNCEVSCLETPSFWRYKGNYVTRNSPETFQDFRETGPSSFDGGCSFYMHKRYTSTHWSFIVAVSTLWNALLKELRRTSGFDNFKSLLLLFSLSSLLLSSRYPWFSL